MRHTKIIATLGPASGDEATIASLVSAGVDVVRLNFSHRTHQDHAEVLARVRAVSERLGRRVAVLQDLSGPKIRTGRLPDGRAIAVRRGDRLLVRTGDGEGGPGFVTTSYAELARSVRAGDRLLLDDGRVELEVVGSDGATIETRVVAGTEIGEHKGINSPGVALPASSLTPKDIEDLEFGLAQGVDLVALSFVQSADDVRRARAHMDRCGRRVPIVAKIERPQAVAVIDEILQVADALMVARGDLGLEMPFEQAPRVQKDLTRRARARGVPVVIATQVLDSMRLEPRPTRAEVTDAANAVGDGADAIMLSGETAVGAHPLRVVETLDAIIRDAERLSPSPVALESGLVGPEHGRAICEAACTLARSGHADAIVAVTRRGQTARSLSALRPGVPILAVTSSLEVARSLMLWRGVQPLRLELADDVSEIEAGIERELVRRGQVKPGSTVVFVSVHADLGERRSNYLRIQRLEPV
jgi:pyruvate kinase